jgi:hypothetical protein
MRMGMKINYLVYYLGKSIKALLLNNNEITMERFNKDGGR